jgi:hypothetical protein
MNRVERRHLAGALLLLLIGIGANGFLMGLLSHNSRRSSSTDLPQVIALSLQGAIQTFTELRSAADVVVHREPTGALRVSGRALKQEVRLSSLGELRTLLKGLPTPGTAFVTVTHASGKSGLQGLLESPAPETIEARRELIAVLEEAGFHLARGSVKIGLPLGQADGRPSAR